MNKTILAIETATNICSVALFKDQKLISIKEDMSRKHATLLAPFVNDIFNESNIKIIDIDAIAISIGPGSYTGLRIGLSFAKGIAYSLNKPIIPINTIESLDDSVQDLNYFIIAHAYKDLYYIQEYRNGKKFKNIIFEKINFINDDSIIYGYSGINIQKNVITINPSSKNIANVAYKYYNDYICKNIKLIKPNYIKPIQFKKNIS
tara:strand:- start:5 stop:619 length:615 start_codon:yes stop_codon:yes gene_type:complete